MTYDGLDFFAGPGGWDEGGTHVGLTTLGVEVDADACATAVAAGHPRLQKDVYDLTPDDVEDWTGKVFLASPPCVAFSKLNKGHSRRHVDELVDAVLAGDWSWGKGDLPDVVLLPLVMGRWVEEFRPRHIAFEQVPSVRPVWEAYAKVLTTMGYSVWTGILDAADYGVLEPCPLHQPAESAENLSPPVTARVYAGVPVMTSSVGEPIEDAWIVVGRLGRTIAQVCAEGATCDERAMLLAAHAEQSVPLTQHGRAGDEWTSAAMSELGTMTASSAESIGLWLKGCWDDPSRPRRLSTTSTEVPTTTIHRILRSIAATVITGRHTDGVDRKVGCGLCLEWATPQHRKRAVLMASLEGPVEPPAPTHGPKGTQPYVTAGEALGWTQETVRDPERLNDQSGTPVDLDWPFQRPALTIAGRPLLCHPGANANRFNGKTKSRNDGFRITEQEMAILQGFRSNYPFHGTRSSQQKQIGNVVPPPFAAAIIRALVSKDD